MKMCKYYLYNFYTNFLQLVLKKLVLKNPGAWSKVQIFLVKFKIQILFCQTITIAEFAEAPMCKILKKVFRKSLFQKRFVLLFAMFFSRIKQNKLFLQASIRQSHKQLLNQRLYKRRTNDCTNVNSTQASIRRSNRLFIVIIFKNSVKIFSCLFNSTVDISCMFAD